MLYHMSQGEGEGEGRMVEGGGGSASRPLAQLLVCYGDELIRQRFLRSALHVMYVCTYRVPLPVAGLNDNSRTQDKIWSKLKTSNQNQSNAYVFFIYMYFHISIVIISPA